MKNKKLTNKDRTPCEIYSRVVGYLRPVNQWNKGKSAEYQLRQEYKPTFDDLTN
jgi:anaerobic ribonucleoside-triphosphate reductase